MQDQQHQQQLQQQQLLQQQMVWQQLMAQQHALAGQAGSADPALLQQHMQQMYAQVMAGMAPQGELSRSALSKDRAGCSCVSADGRHVQVLPAGAHQHACWPTAYHVGGCP